MHVEQIVEGGFGRVHVHFACHYALSWAEAHQAERRFLGPSKGRGGAVLANGLWQWVGLAAWPACGSEGTGLAAVTAMDSGR
jgi:hypothetical protein